ncbi:MAG: thioredoxin fold domain-containing protein [Gammaproteobacteria bacterium]|nr:thioredoxin fold domain-containing protein [Gammaproteobacteria bacterium]MDH3450274.1 thioredoxin fold domain-containing protein [Gammaproteobacteria bacterium]
MSDQIPNQFDDTLLENELEYPDWFKISLGDLNDDIAEARAAGKFGIMVYYGQSRCAYCARFFDVNLADETIQHYVRKHFDVVPVDIWGIEEFVDTDGKPYSERELSLRYETNFTPSLVFYDRNGKPVYRLRGYYPPYQFGAVLRYVIEGFYRVEKFRDYLERADPDLFFTTGELIERDFFSAPPYDLDRSRRESDRPLAVIFAQGSCHACELLHTGPLSQQEILAEIEKMDVVQLNLLADTEVITPAGRTTTAKQWGKDLNLFYTPTIVFFSPGGKEIMRIDSVVQFYRLWGVLDYVNRRGYEKNIDYQAWRLQQRQTTE